MTSNLSLLNHLTMEIRHPLLFIKYNICHLLLGNTIQLNHQSYTLSFSLPLNLFKQCCFILWNLLGNIQHWKCLSYSALCPTPNLFFFKTWRRKRVFLDCKFTREVLNFLQKKCFRYIDFVICVWLIGLPDSRTWPAFQDSSCWTRVLWWRGLWCETLHPWFDEISAVQTRGKPWDFSKQGTGKEFTGFHRF